MSISNCVQNLKISTRHQAMFFSACKAYELRLVQISGRFFFVSLHLGCKGQKVIVKCKLDCLPVRQKHLHRRHRHHNHHYHQMSDYMPRGRLSKYHHHSITCLFSLTSEMNCQVNGKQRTAGEKAMFRRPERVRPAVCKYL